MFIITGRNTFSSGTLLAVDLASRAAVTVVGEPMGGSPSLFVGTEDVALPYSGLVLTIASALFEPVPGDPRLEVAPDVAVALHLADFLAGRDPALAAVEGR